MGDATQASIAGLDGIHYLDKTDSFRNKTQTGDVHITAETDRVYLNTAHPLTLADPVLQRRIVVTKENSLTTVIWNPWSEKALTMSDLGQDQWKKMLCIETSNVGDFAVQLAPGQQHTMKAIVSVCLDSHKSIRGFQNGADIRGGLTVDWDSMRRFRLS